MRFTYLAEELIAAKPAEPGNPRDFLGAAHFAVLIVCGVGGARGGKERKEIEKINKYQRVKTKTKYTNRRHMLRIFLVFFFVLLL